MAILIINPFLNTELWLNEFHLIDPAIDVRIWPNVGNIQDITFALVWHYPQGELRKYPNLKCISSLGAGVDHILSDPYLPKEVPIVRVIDQFLTRDMTQYILFAVLNYTRLFALYRQQQLAQQWIRHPANNEVTIGVMGLGQLGADTAKKIASLGFNVQGWSRSTKQIAGINTFHENKSFATFLQQTHVLINLLPLTPETKNILNATTFHQLPRGAYLINVSRGQHLVEEDLIAALDTGQLSGAFLDVFCEEPLPTTHPFWCHPKITLTPHIASMTNAKSVVPQIVDNYRNALEGKALLNQVDLSKGY